MMTPSCVGCFARGDILRAVCAALATRTLRVRMLERWGSCGRLVRRLRRMLEPAPKDDGRPNETRVNGPSDGRTAPSADARAWLTRWTHEPSMDEGLPMSAGWLA